MNIDSVYVRPWLCYRLVSAGGDIKITKDGQILLKEVVCGLFSLRTVFGEKNFAFPIKFCHYKSFERPFLQSGGSVQFVGVVSVKVIGDLTC